jgi:nucleoside-diphosphate-sugar epimerase
VPAFEYAHRKAECERILERAHEAGEVPLTIIRPAATYNDTWSPIALIGPGPSFLRRLRQGRPVILLGDGQSLWVSCHRDDQAVAFVGAIGNPKAVGRTYDTPGDEFMTWTEYYATAARVMGAPPLDRVCIPSELLARMAPAEASWCAWNFQYNNLLDSSAARADLGFAPRVTWAEGVRRMVAHHDSLGAIDSAPEVPLYDRIVETWRRIEKDAVAAMAPA